MTALSRTAGAAGSIDLETKNSAGQLITPVSTPSVKWYTSTADRTADTGGTALTVTGSGSSYDAAWTAGQAPATPATRYLRFLVEVSTGVFDIDAQHEVSFVDAVVVIDEGIITLAETKAWLNREVDDYDQQDEIVTLIAAATAWVEKVIGPVLPRTITEVHKGGRETVRLHNRVVAVTSVTEYSAGVATVLAVSDLTTSPVPEFGYRLEARRRRLTRYSAGISSVFAGGSDVEVVYTAGFAVVPDDIKLYAKEHVRLWFQPTQQGSRPSLGDTDADEATSPGRFHSVGGVRKALLDAYPRPGWA